MNHFHDDPLHHDHEHSDPRPGEWSLDASSLNANTAHRPSLPHPNPTPLENLAQVMIVGRDGPWVLVFVPLNRDLLWVDLERSPFRLQDYDPLAGEPAEDSRGEPCSGDDWDPEGGWPLY